MKQTFFRLLIVALLAGIFLPAGFAGAINITNAISSSAIQSAKGATVGALSALKTRDQAGTADTPSKYVAFTTPGTTYKGYRTYTLPANVNASSLTSLSIQANYKGPAKSSQMWSWYLFNWNSSAWTKIGDNTAAKANAWTLLTFNISNPGAYVSSQGVIRLQLVSGNATGDAKLDFESISYTFDCQATENTAFEQKVIQLINQKRSQQNPPLPALKSNEKLTAAAHLHSIDMACQNYFSHDSLNGNNFVKRIENQGYKWLGLGENIAAGYGTPAEVVAGWMKSPGHKANILNADYKDVGIGYAYLAGSDYGHYWTADFGKPNP